MMLDPAEWLVKHSSTAGLGEWRMVSVYTGAPGSRRVSRRRCRSCRRRADRADCYQTGSGELAPRRVGWTGLDSPDTSNAKRAGRNTTTASRVGRNEQSCCIDEEDQDAGDKLAMVVVGRDGGQEELTTWLALDGTTATPRGQTSTSVDQIASDPRGFG
jgi:hypothetical protein